MDSEEWTNSILTGSADPGHTDPSFPAILSLGPSKHVGAFIGSDEGIKLRVIFRYNPNHISFLEIRFTIRSDNKPDSTMASIFLTSNQLSNITARKFSGK